MTIDPQVAGVSRDDVIARLAAGNPGIAVAPAGKAALHLNPMTLEPGEEQIVLERLIEAVKCSDQ